MIIIKLKYNKVLVHVHILKCLIMLFCYSFKVPCLTSWSLIDFEFTFVQDESYRFSLIFQQVGLYFLKHHLLKMMYFFPLNSSDKKKIK